MNIYSRNSGVHFSPQHLNTCGRNACMGSVWEEGDKEAAGREVKGGGA